MYSRKSGLLQKGENSENPIKNYTSQVEMLMPPSIGNGLGPHLKIYFIFIYFIFKEISRSSDETRAI